jgi:LPXTG-site transpeptidase (sortase) family protein
LASLTDRRRLLLFLPVVALLALNGLVWTARGAVSRPLERAEVRVASPPQASPTPVTTAGAGPIEIPEDPYAPEPVVAIGTIQIPKLGLSHTLYDGVTLTVIDHGPSHWPGTALPGQPGNVVVAGHRVTHDRPFLDIDKLAPGDDVIFLVGGTRSVYKVTGTLIVRPTDTWIVLPTPGATATLYACHPKYSKAQRYVVRLALA